MDEKKYLVRLYITSNELGIAINAAIDSGLCKLVRSLAGMNDVLAIYDVEINSFYFQLFLILGIDYLPLNHYEDFIITCPCCGERVDDSMILNVYDDKLLSGYNIRCNRTEKCGYAHAKVEYLC